jgi:hypothetical protein
MPTVTQILVTAIHPTDNERHGCSNEPFRVHVDAFDSRISISGKWGCSKGYSSIDAAVREMARDHGCNALSVAWEISKTV